MRGVDRWRWTMGGGGGLLGRSERWMGCWWGSWFEGVLGVAIVGWLSVVNVRLW